MRGWWLAEFCHNDRRAIPYALLQVVKVGDNTDPVHWMTEGSIRGFTDNPRTALQWVVTGTMPDDCKL